MRVIITTVLLLCSSISISQNTFYTKGLRVDEFYDEQAGLFRKLSENENYLSTFRVMDMFSRVNMFSYNYNVTLDVDSTSVEDDYDGYSLYCTDSTGESAIVTVNLDQMVIVVWLYGRDNKVIREEFAINIIK
jgi:hypothetical protein